MEPMPVHGLSRHIALVWLSASLVACITDDAPAEEGDPDGQSSAADGTTPSADAGLDARRPADGAMDTDADLRERDARVEVDATGRPLRPECQQVCSFRRACGADDPLCSDDCHGLSEEALECFVDGLERQDCGEFLDCYERFGEHELDPEENCRDLCERRFRCLSRECAPGTVVGSYLQRCQLSCLEDPPDLAAFEREIQTLCEDLIETLLEEDEEVAERCRAEPDPD